MVVKEWRNGDKYEGGWENGEKNGQGTLFYVDGGKYEGEWASNMRNGYGINIWANGDRYEGDWQNNLKHGEGKLFYANGGKYTGEWKNNIRHGQGVNIWRNGTRYEGFWKENQQHAKGTFTYPDGGKYVGEWLANMRHGNGVNTWANGDRYEGLWNHNRKHGEGTFYHADGTEEHGIWNNDTLNGDSNQGSDNEMPKNDNCSKNALQFKGFWLNGQPFVVLLMPKSSVCPYLTLGREFIVSLNWDKAYFDRTHDNCYCSRCYKESWNDVIEAGDDRYVIPRGWVRLGLHTDPAHMKAEDIWNKWIVTFHGTTKIAAQSIIKHRHFCLPGDVLIDGTKLGIRPGHIPDKQFIYTSPTIAYSSGLAYSPIYDFHSTENNANYQTQIVLQCRQMPNSYKIGPETIGAGKNQICSHISNSEIEYFTDRRGSLVAYGVLVRFRPKNN
ncbi:unnamed protein product [Rotaria magnacalcarata]|uniref:Uncharacterized protein n=1 Tax=Rotaria magnacalcarata TaxID=392030 RepID=A0A816N3W7_9BILA|nr:unnamed protein product [Rotaria magnacalcarata]CAF1645454.1 unnamed protein product [Rotaria magnacalcarata]CAF2020777.1 unnamed protein product [Rotaria magnacalcarata]CAF3758811.1 unnamed protein product [Rotaria magnacalcarata]CAF3800860.1 unnamed protein product [Rotaria magnacalcarata]